VVVVEQAVVALQVQIFLTQVSLETLETLVFYRDEVQVVQDKQVAFQVQVMVVEVEPSTKTTLDLAVEVVEQVLVTL
jgi:hypothetical protein